MTLNGLEPREDGWWWCDGCTTLNHPNDERNVLSDGFTVCWTCAEHGWEVSDENDN